MRDAEWHICLETQAEVLPILYTVAYHVVAILGALYVIDR